MDRRMFLRGAATTLWLPMLPSALPRAAWATQPTAPRRGLWWFMPNGFVRRLAAPTSFGQNYDLPQALSGVAPMQSRISVISGLENLAAGRTDSHENATPTLLGDKEVDNTFSGPLDGSITIDQFAAQVIGTSTPFGSLQLGTDEPFINAGFGNIDTFYRTLSWSGPQTPLTPLSDPKTVFDRMFAGSDPELTEAEREKRRGLRKSLLDSVLERTKPLEAVLSADDRAKFDQYTTGVRELEVRIDRLAALECPTPQEPPASPGFQAKVSLMTDLMVVALQCDYTRLITFGTGASTTLTVYNWLGHGIDHHSLSHNYQYNNNDERRLAEVYEWNVAQWVNLCAKLAAVETGAGDLLSHTATHFVSEFGESNFHEAEPLTILLAGGEAGGILQGRHRLYSSTPHSNLWQSILGFLEVDPTGFGTTATGSLDLSAEV